MRRIHASRLTSLVIGANTVSENKRLRVSDAQQLRILHATSSALSAFRDRTSSSSRSLRRIATRQPSIAVFTARYPSCLWAAAKSLHSLTTRLFNRVSRHRFAEDSIATALHSLSAAAAVPRRLPEYARSAMTLAPAF